MAQFKIVDDITYPHFVGLVPNKQTGVEFCARLQSLGIDCATRFSGASIGIYVANQKDVSRAKIELLSFCNKSFTQSSTASKAREMARANGLMTYLQTALVRFNFLSVVTAIEVICVIAYVYGLFDANIVYALLCLYDIRQITDSAQIWRLLTPIFVHFSILHIAFNLVMFEAFARGIENKIGTVKILSLVISSGLISNALQFLLQNHETGSIFGGLSGVVYAVIGYMAMLSRRKDLPDELYMPQGLLTVSVIFIGIGFLLGGVANICHLGGLLVGLAVGYFDMKKLRF